MHFASTYSKNELISLREGLRHALDEKRAVLGFTKIETTGSVARGVENPNDIDLKVSIAASLADSAVQEAAKDAVRFVIQTFCFDSQRPRLVRKENIWQWPIDISISDGILCLYLKPVKTKKAELIFDLLPV
jgi:hypothetical protein